MKESLKSLKAFKVEIVKALGGITPYQALEIEWATNPPGVATLHPTRSKEKRSGAGHSSAIRLNHSCRSLFSPKIIIRVAHGPPPGGEAGLHRNSRAGTAKRCSMQNHIWATPP